ncbi:hypothetical protein FJ420_17185 [Mesorhizobium sp. B3-1-3]|uniref:hypothetical protein n=1 Tax=unclassified Mesorhizobium TaxID=325217 RepID=UPI00112D7688|nr:MULTISPECIES: hypothetical protein [unclassified Mesorhizobium]TPI64255.1 hypothetical protein FJ424_17975 [Mesorhizobium sp. B3-1-8]TPI70265.1 hypothetical protein FJ420_17185 [Mesorhizobium sp. B3-1-3]
MPQNNPSQYTVSQLLAYYHDEVVPALATAVTLDHAFPQEVLNELRNAMTHMARANALDASQAHAAQKELHSAHRHLLRCTLDSLKVVLLAIAKPCDEMMKALNDEMLLPGSVHTEARKLRARRIDISTHEGQRPIDEVVEKLKVLCDDYDKFSEKLQTEFSGDTIVQRRGAIRKAKWIERAWGFVVGLVAGIIVTLVAWEWLPPPS